MNMTRPGNGLFHRPLEILQKTFCRTHPVRQVRRNDKLRPRIEISLHLRRMESHTPAMRLMRNHQPRLCSELRGNIYQLQVVLERKIIPACMTIHQQRFTLRAELQILPERLFKSPKIGAARLMLMRHQQQLFLLQGIEKLFLYGGIFRYPCIDTIITCFLYSMAEGRNILGLVPPERGQYFYFHA